MSAKRDYDYIVNLAPSDNDSVEAWCGANMQKDDAPKWVRVAKKGRVSLSPTAINCSPKHDGDDGLVEVWSEAKATNVEAP